LTQALRVHLYLSSKLTGGSKNDRAHSAGPFQTLYDRQQKGGRLAGARLGRGYYVTPGEGMRYRFLLDFGWLCYAELRKSIYKRPRQAKLVEIV
jgi:hypothetical protein